MDDLFDRELDPAARAKLFGELRGNLPLATHMERTQAVIDALREAPPSPDLSKRVVREWERRRTMPKLKRVAIAASAQVATEVVKPWWQAATPWAAAACVTIAFVGVVVYRWGGHAPQPSAESTRSEPVAAAPEVVEPQNTPAPGASEPKPLAAQPGTGTPPPRMMPGLQAGPLSNRLLTQAPERGFVLLGGSGVANSWRPTARLHGVFDPTRGELPAYLMTSPSKTFPVVSRKVGLWNEPTIVQIAPVGAARSAKGPGPSPTPTPGEEPRTNQGEK